MDLLSQLWRAHLGQCGVLLGVGMVCEVGGCSTEPPRAHRRDLSPGLKRDNCLRNKVKPHRDLGGEEGNMSVTVPEPPGATGLENHVPDHRPVHLTGQRADGGIA